MTDSLLRRTETLERAQRHLNSKASRTILGIVGKPGSGKSTLAQFLLDQLPEGQDALVPMDGFHLSNEELVILGRRDRKGAPDTFDVGGYAKLLESAKKSSGEIHFPIFHREIEASIADEGFLKPEIKLVITEGNYLLHSDDGWGIIQPLLDESWYVDVDDSIRLERLIARHIEFGKSPEEARDWALGTDERNAKLIERTRSRANFLISA